MICSGGVLQGPVQWCEADGAQSKVALVEFRSRAVSSWVHAVATSTGWAEHTRGFPPIEHQCLIAKYLVRVSIGWHRGSCDQVR